MSVFTNPAGAAKEHGRAYTEATLALLGDHDPFVVLEEQPEWLARTVARIGPGALRVPERPGKWSVLHALWHLADTEVVFRYRLRSIAGSPGCAIIGFDQDAWADRLHYADADPTEALELIRVLRRSTLRWLRSLSPDERRAWGEHSERGRESIEHMTRMMAGHDILHRNQIDRSARAVTAPPPPAV